MTLIPHSTNLELANYYGNLGTLPIFPSTAKGFQSLGHSIEPGNTLHTIPCLNDILHRLVTIGNYEILQIMGFKGDLFHLPAVAGFLPSKVSVW